VTDRAAQHGSHANQISAAPKSVASRHSKIVLFTGSGFVADAAKANILPTYRTVPMKLPERSLKQKLGNTIKRRFRLMAL